MPTLGKTVHEHLAGWAGLLTYYAGIFNGNGRNITINDNNNFMFAGRLELQPFTGKVLVSPPFSS